MAKAPFCIYCSETDPVRFKSVEHVIPQAFGKFADQTPTLIGVVCDGCNKHFAANGDLLLARASTNGLRRLRYGQSTKRSYPDARLRLTYPIDPALGPLSGTKATIDMRTLKIMPTPVHLRITNLQTGEDEHYLAHELERLNYHPDVYGSPAGALPATLRVQIDCATSLKELEEFTALVQAQGVPYNPGPVTYNEITPPPFADIEQSEEIDVPYRQALAKVLINFAAKFISVEEVVSERWNSVRAFVRYGIGELGLRFSETDGWDEPGHSPIWPGVRVKLWNHSSGIVGSLKFYDGPQYDILLVKNQQLHDDHQVEYEFVNEQRPLRLCSQ